jgi:hypothetical protein
MYSEKPDLYGPFWIYTTLIVILAILGNLAHYFDLMSEGADLSNFKCDFKFVPTAAIIIYSVGLGLPLALKVIMKFMGAQFFGNSFIEVRNTY